MSSNETAPVAPAVPSEPPAESPAAPAPAPAPAPADSQAPSMVQTLAERALETVAPAYNRVKEALPKGVAEKLEDAVSQASTTLESLQSGRAGSAVREKFSESEKLVRDKTHEGQEYVKAKFSEGSALISSYLSAMPTSFADIQKLGADQYENLLAAIAKLRASLPANIPEFKLPEERVVEIRSSINKVLESLPKMPPVEVPKVDFSKYNSQEIVKFGQKLVDQITPYVAPYQERLHKLLAEYKVQERSAEIYKEYRLDKVAPAFVTNLVTGSTSEAAATPTQAPAAANGEPTAATEPATAE